MLLNKIISNIYLKYHDTQPNKPCREENERHSSFVCSRVKNCVKCCHLMRFKWGGSPIVFTMASGIRDLFLAILIVLQVPQLEKLATLVRRRCQPTIHTPVHLTNYKSTETVLGVSVGCELEQGITLMTDGQHNTTGKQKV